MCCLDPRGLPYLKKPRRSLVLILPGFLAALAWWNCYSLPEILLAGSLHKFLSYISGCLLPGSASASCYRRQRLNRKPFCLLPKPSSSDRYACPFDLLSLGYFPSVPSPRTWTWFVLLFFLTWISATAFNSLHPLCYHPRKLSKRRSDHFSP